MSGSPLEAGVLGHRGFGRRSVSAYNSHVSNAIHFACVKDEADWIVEPLGWALLVARGGDAEKETVGDPHGDAEMSVHVSLGWRRVDEGDAGFDDLWRALHEQMDRRKIRLSRRTGSRAVFWVAPDTHPAPDRMAVLEAMNRLDAGAPPDDLGQARVWFVRHPATHAPYPAKIVWGLASGQIGRDFSAHEARDGLRKLGFDVPGPDQPAAEIAESPESLAALPSHMEGAERQVTRNERERNPMARRAAEAHWRALRGSLVCEGCEIDFARTYGPRGAGFMHFHHLSPLANATGARPVDGTRDLVPLCPNCHAIVHRGEEVLDIEALRVLLGKPDRSPS